MSGDSTVLLAGVLVARPRRAAGLPAGDAESDARRRHQTQLMRDYVDRFRGHVERVGGDVLLAVFDSVSAATQAAICLHRRFALQSGALTTCISGGELRASQLGFSGAAIEQALEICAAGDPDTCVVTELAAELVGSRIPLVLKREGLHRLLQWQAQRSMSESLGVPPAVRIHDRTPLIGRAGEMRKMSGALDQAMEGDATWVSITGEAGMGKTRLISEFATQAHGAGALVLCGVATEDLAQPFAPVVQALSYWADNVDELPLRLGPQAGELGRLLPDLRRQVTDMPSPSQSYPESQRQQLFGAVSSWLIGLTDECPVLLVLDSLHWETDSTIQMLEHLAAKLAGRRIMVLTTTRPGSALSDRLYDAALRALGKMAVRNIQLKGLDADQIEQFLLKAGRQVDSAMAQSLRVVTGGSPLHLAQMIVQAEVSSESAERSVHQALTERIARLPAEVRGVVETAAVIGEVFELRDVADVMDDPDEAADAIDSATDTGLFHLLDDRHLRYRFVHSLTRDAAYAGIRPARRARMHEHIGLALEKRDPTAAGARLADLSRHFRQALSLGQDERAVRYTLLAADQALAQYANDVALSLYNETLDLFGEFQDERQRARALIGKGRAQRRLGEPDYRLVLVKAADLSHAINDAELMALATIAAYRGSYTRALHVDEEAVARLRRALALLGEAGSVEKARLLSLLAVELTWHPDHTLAPEASGEAIAVARAVADSQVLTEVLAHDQWVRFHPTSQRLEVANELARLEADCEDPRLRFEIASHDMFTATRIGDRGRLDVALETARQLVEKLQQPPERSMLLLREATLALMEARFRDVHSLIGQRRELANRIGEADGEAAFMIHQFWLAFDTQPQEACQKILEVRRGQLAPAHKYQSWPTVLAFACDAGVYPVAEKILNALAADGFDSAPPDQMWLWNISQIAYATARLEQRQWVDELIELLIPQRSRHSNMVFNTLGSTARYLGLLYQLRGDQENAQQCLREAIAANQLINAPGWAARCQLDLAELLLQQGENARQLIDEALATVSRLKMPLVNARAARLCKKVADS